MDSTLRIDPAWEINSNDFPLENTGETVMKPLKGHGLLAKAKQVICSNILYVFISSNQVIAGSQLRFDVDKSFSI